MGGWSTPPAVPDWFEATHQNRTAPASVVQLVLDDGFNVSLLQRPWREGLTRADVLCCVSSNVFHGVYEPIRPGLAAAPVVGGRDEVLTCAEAAAAMRCSLRTVALLCETGRLVGFKAGVGKSAGWRVTRRALDAYMGLDRLDREVVA